MATILILPGRLLPQSEFCEVPQGGPILDRSAWDVRTTPLPIKTGLGDVLSLTQP